MTAATASPTPNEVKSTTTVPTPAPSTTPEALMSEQVQDVPIFLRKTYHMIDTCDPTVASWSDDGETFIVKDPVKFEKQIIPQFFKHSKFSSFVRQLNFYAFRKIKYADTIRIDPKLEAETANYWRFRHEKFLRGKPELLGEIKRMNGQKQQQKQAAAVPKAPVVEEALKSEVTTLKKRIEEMNKNIDQLTSMVQKVTLAQATVPVQREQEETINQNNKRTKVESPSAVELSPVPDEAVSGILKSSTPSSMDLDDIPMPPSVPSPIRQTERESSATSDLSDEGFVDQLFSAFGSGDFEFEESASVAPVEKPKNHPRPELMNRLSEALALLPADIQEMIVERLIQAITSPKEIQENIQAAKKINEIGNGAKAVPSAVPQSPKAGNTPAEKPVNLNLAAATLAALLQHFGDDQKAPSAAHKALLIPVHA
eukprot:CAMPEP_0117051610 /NCGR_PEP_ID=MMETSP0472-20121206/35656_1 /TAXON_ID=693140 ORGANISM="Tiarina fusus, Strain LIS" /NCGR_SAMPLE_ID=MMETSP0472 /ASSEMBLY_ACC=CAM_ASM_000603 /LENGTH=426 /DNA_ID=CAMNT_0004765883 /DNA_START=216 /DNA_END=1496 /DNA_ORIENTATION=-